MSASTEALHQQGLAAAAARRYPAAQAAWQAAAAEGHAGAMTHLAILLQHGMGVPADASRAMGLYQQAMAAGEPEAAVRLAIAALHGRWLPAGSPLLVQALAVALAAGHPLAQAALSVLARWAGSALPGDTGQRLAWLRTALSLPLPACDTLHTDPGVAVANDVLDDTDCRWLIEAARPHLHPAVVINPHTRALVQVPARNNQSAPLGQRGPDLRLNLLEWRMAQIAGLPLAHAEYLAVLCYRPGEEYRPHRDYLLPSAHPDQFAPGGPGQRVRTTCTYLNAVDGGGQTAFPQLDLEVAPVPGRIVVFDNVDASGQPEPRSLHAGRPVLAGEKWLATLWFRERPLRKA